MPSRTRMKDVANALGLAPSTVSRALASDDSPHVSVEVRDRVRAMCATMGYRPNLSARRLRTGRTDTIGLLAYEQYSLFFQWVTSLVHDVVSAQGLGLLVDTPARLTALHGPAALANQWAVDGVVAYDVAADHPDMLTRLGLPVVVCGPSAPAGIDHIASDIADGARQAMDHLLSLGRRRIAFIGPEDRDDAAEPRRAVYRQALDEAGLEPTMLLGPVSGNRPDVRAFLTEYASGQPLPDAIFCVNDEHAIGCLRALADLGVRVPDDVAVVGFDGTVDSAFTSPDLTTIEQPVAAMCRLAVDLLARRREQPDAPPEHHVFPCRLVQRGSA